ncbi:hypothetical protein ACFC09_01545 [Streptomyces sp. NPDC056161]|uniref:hypothetical protein n=1 Tax=Streptomyces sp. NPDC056161 TaxID=3345732 RepID=UPI0035D9A749
MSDKEWPEGYEESDTASRRGESDAMGWKAVAGVVVQVERVEPDTMRTRLHTACRPPLAHHTRRRRLRTEPVNRASREGAAQKSSPA